MLRERRPEPDSLREDLPNGHVPDSLREEVPNGHRTHLPSEPLPDHVIEQDIAEIEQKIDEIEQKDIEQKEYKEKDDDQEWGHCLTPDCNRKNIVYDKRLDCTSCGMSWCVQCGVQWHLGQTCQQYQADSIAEQNALLQLGNMNGFLGNVNELYGGVEEQQFQAMYQEQYNEDKMRTCQKCFAVIQKDGGCNHMTCHCGHHFCWLCDQEVDPQHLDQHYEIGVCLLNEVDAV